MEFTLSDFWNLETMAVRCRELHDEMESRRGWKPREHFDYQRQPGYFEFNNLLQKIMDIESEMENTYKYYILL
jgi:hypothetical protein